MRTGTISSFFSIASATLDTRTAQTRSNVFFHKRYQLLFSLRPKFTNAHFTRKAGGRGSTSTQAPSGVEGIIYHCGGFSVTLL